MTDIEQIQSIRSQTLAQLDALRADPEADVLDRRPARALAGVRRVARSGRSTGATGSWPNASRLRCGRKG